MSTAVHSWYRQCKRQWHALRSRLRHQRAAVGLAVLLSLSLGEPLMCIVHCQIWIPLAYQSYFAAQHPHDHHAHTAHSAPSLAAEMPTETIRGLQANAATPAAGSIYFTNCTVQGASDTPFHVPPSPVHDILPTLIAVIAFVLMILIRPAAAPRDPPKVAHPLHLRPPIPFAV